MGRPRGFDRDVALERAMRLFWDHGYEQTSVSDLTRELGISAPSLYAAFGSKRELFAEAVARYEADPRSVTTVGLPGENAQDIAGRMFAQAAREYTSEAHPKGCFVNSEPGLIAHRDRNRALTAARLDDVRGERRDDSAVIAAYVQAVLVGLSSYARDGATEEQLRQVADLALRATAPSSPDDDV